MGPFKDGWTEQDVEAVLARGNPDELLYVPIVITMDSPDCDWSEAICLTLSQHMHFNVRGNAVLGFGHLARICGRLNLAAVIPVISAALNDEHEHVCAHARDAADDIRHYLGVRVARQASTGTESPLILVNAASEIIKVQVLGHISLRHAFLLSLLFLSACQGSPMQNMPTPDLPQPFGYKCAWIAVRADSPTAVAAALHLQDVAPSTWAEGIDAAYDGRVFVTPQIAGWVLAVGTVLADAGDEHNPDHISPVLLRLGQQFPEVQFFGTHHVVEWHAWARVVAGDFVRKFAYVGDQGVVVWQHGSLSPEETRLGLRFTASTIDDGPFPDEQNVTDLAGLWSVDPTRLEDLGLSPSTGLLGVYPQ